MSRHHQWHFAGVLGLAMVLMLAASLPAASAISPTVTVTVNRSRAVGKSQLAVGVSHMQYSVDAWGNPQATANGQRLLASGVTFQNQHIMGFGVDNPMPAPGRYDWETLDARVQMMRAAGATMVLTLAGAPTWMVDPHWSGGTDWSQLEAAPLPQHYADFAELARQIALRYPDVTYFQVWNEFKGMWDDDANNWDYVAYTALYNKVYDALKSVNPNIQVGGPYLVIEGTGTQTGEWYTATPLTKRNLTVIDYWMQYKHGADFITVDRSFVDDHDDTSYSPAQMLSFASQFERITQQLRQRTGLPVWFAEDYFISSDNWNLQAVSAATMLYHELLGGASVSLRWQPQGEAGDDHQGNNQALFSDTRVRGGGQPYPAYAVYKAFHDHFGPGTILYSATSSSPDIEVLASATRTLLINRRPAVTIVRLNGVSFAMAPYQVVVQ
jgi:hypothetical protein